MVKWSAEELTKLAELQSLGWGSHRIGKYLGRHKSSVWVKMTCGGGPKLFPRSGEDPSISEAQAEDRNKRRGTRYSNMISEMCGDPLPGYSALDKRK